MDRCRMAHLVTVGGAFEAKVLAARLGTEGVVCELRGGVDGPYPMGSVHVYVEEHMLDAARELLEVEPLGVDDEDELLARALRRPGGSWVLVGIVVALLALTGAAIARVVKAAEPRPIPAEQPARP
ncbi:MAG TPA: hypothetical protein VF855_07805 [Acidimicrobiales bacterium]